MMIYTCFEVVIDIYNSKFSRLMNLVSFDQLEI